MILRYAIIDRQIKVVFLDGDFTRVKDLVLCDLRSCDYLLRKPYSVIDDIIIQCSVALYAASGQRSQSFRLIDLNFDEALFNVVFIDRHSECLLRLSIKSVELSHNRNLILVSDGFPFSYEVLSLLIPEYLVRRIIRSLDLEWNVQPVSFRHEAKNVIFPFNRHVYTSITTVLLLLARLRI